jgi:hypothetical protein
MQYASRNIMLLLICLSFLTAGVSAQNRKLVNSIHKELLRVHQRKKAVFENFCAGWTEFKGAARFKPVSDADYDAFRKMFGDNEGLWKLIE